MGQTTAETVKEIEETRQRLGRNIDELEERLPARVTVAKRTAGILACSGIAGSAAWFAVRRVRARRQQNKHTQPVQAVIQVVPENWLKKFEDADVRKYAGGFAAAYLVLRMLELRRMRMMNRALMRT